MGSLLHTYSCEASRGRAIALASLHGKERAMERPLRVGLGLSLRLAMDVNTDLFGTFAGEVERPTEAFETCRLKAEAAMDALGLDLGIASEGSFGPHPSVPMLAMGAECLVIVDRCTGRVLREQAISNRTNFSAIQVADADAAHGWLREVGFPSHRVMVRAHASNPTAGRVWLAKGVDDPSQLVGLIAAAVAQSPLHLAWLETDMRAHCNPTRMQAIRRLVFQLVRRLHARCPSCQAPGFGVLDTIAGLPCSSCGLSSRWVIHQCWGCDVCGFEELRARPDGLSSLDPMYCDYCNP